MPHPHMSPWSFLMNEGTGTWLPTIATSLRPSHPSGVQRHPYPGPGLSLPGLGLSALACIGAMTTQYRGHARKPR